MYADCNEGVVTFMYSTNKKNYTKTFKIKFLIDSEQMKQEKKTQNSSKEMISFTV